MKITQQTRLTPFLTVLWSYLMCFGGMAEEPKNYGDLGETLTSAIAHRDLLEFCHCWYGMRDTRVQIAEARKAGEKLPEKELQDLFDDERKRNAIVVKTFELLQKALDTAGVERKSIKLKQIKGHGHRTEEPIERVGGFTFTFSTNKGDMKFDVDDGAKVKDLWYLTDRPDGVVRIGEKSYPLR